MPLDNRSRRPGDSDAGCGAGEHVGAASVEREDPVLAEATAVGQEDGHGDTAGGSFRFWKTKNLLVFGFGNCKGIHRETLKSILAFLPLAFQFSFFFPLLSSESVFNK